MPYCSACGYELQRPEDELHDPDNDMEIIPGGNEAENPHLAVRDGPSDTKRLYCTDLGHSTKIENEPPEGEGQEKDNQQQTLPRGNGEVYNEREEKEPLDILNNVITRPFVGLNDEQVDELRDWAKDYDGQLPPDILENILENMSGVAKQTAALAREKYEVKLNRWVQKQSQADDGPPIGAASRPTPVPNRSGGRSNRGGPQPTGGGGGQSQSGQKGGEQEGQPQQGPGSGGVGNSFPAGGADQLRKARRRRRISRRNDALDRAAEQFADKAAGQMAEEFGGLIGDTRDILYTAFKKKAESDPEWFFEKAEKWDLEILDTFLTPSEAKMEEGEDDGHEVDMEVDDALDAVSPPEEPTEQPKQEGEGMEELLDEPEEEQGEEDNFEEHFGDLDGEMNVEAPGE